MTSEPSSDNRVPNPDQSIDQARSPSRSKAITKQKRSVVNRAVLLILVVTVLFVLVPMLKIFFTPLLLACAFASLFFPFYIVLLKFFRGNRGIGALSCCVILVLGFVIPAYFLGYLVTHQLLALYQSIESTAQAFVQGGNAGFLARFEGNHLLAWLTQHHINWQNTALDMLKTAGGIIANMVNKTSLGALEIIIGLFVTLFIMFYLFMDGERIVKKFRQLLPLHTAYQDMIITRFLLVSRATVKGTLVIAVIQGSLGGIILLVFGVKTWLLWGVVMIVLALIPMIGAWVILIPAAIIQMATGHVWQGIVILALSFGVVSMVDNILRPRLVGQNARLHDLLIFFSTIGGLAMFGPMGVITGPVIMAFFVSITEIYTMELKEHFGGPEKI
ncbi:MAG: AI-2E family transporter [Chitinispirillaceae bacterium]|nr:AI-2E family transporter [Chitinispirillaceae bacterium]